MNLFFGIGKILNDINYGFLMDSKSFSAASTRLEICKYLNSTSSTTITIKGFDNIADRMYRKLEKNMSICLIGQVTTKGYIEILNFKIL